MQKKRTRQRHHSKDGHYAKVVELHGPGTKRKERPIHRVRRRAQNAPTKLWIFTVFVVAAAFFWAGSSWSEGRSSVYAEQLAVAEIELKSLSEQLGEAEQARDDLKEHIVILDAQIADAPDQATVDRLKLERNSALDEVAELGETILGWQGRVAVLEGQLARAEQSVENQVQIIRTQRNRANTLQRAETLRIEALPGQIVANLTASPPYDTGDYQIAIAQETLKEAFGQSFFGWMDELKSVTARGNATFIAAGSYEAENQGDVTEVKLPLPTLVSHGIYDYTLESFDYEPGFLARVDVQDVSELMVWVENSYLVPTACADASTMHSIVESAEAQTQSVVGEREIKVVWISQSGQEFTSEQLSDSILLANAC